MHALCAGNSCSKTVPQSVDETQQALENPNGLVVRCTLLDPFEHGMDHAEVGLATKPRAGPSGW